MKYFLIVLSYFRAICIFPLAVLQFSLLCLLVLICSILFLPKKINHVLLEHFWAKPLLKILNVKINIVGRENLPKPSCSVLYLFNHSSLLDIPLLLLVAPHIYFGAKASLFKIPVFGWIIRLYGILKIERNKGRKTVSMYKTKAVKRAAKGDSFALAPEGGRRYQKERLSPFKTGPFLLSIFAQIPVVPVVIVGVHQVLPKSALFFSWGRWKSQIQISILPSQSVDGYLEESVTLFKDNVYALMQKEYVKCVQSAIEPI